MKLLFCDNTIWGLVNFREMVFRHFYENGHEIVLVAPSDEHTEMKVCVPDYVRFVPVLLDRTSRNPLSDLGYMRRLLRIYRKERPDIIFHYTIKPNIYGTLAARMCGIPSVAMVAGLGYAFTSQGITGTISRRLYRFSLRYARRVFVLNEENYRELLTHRIADERKLVLLPGGEGIDTSKLLPSIEPCKEGVTRFLMVARVLYDKGYSEFVEASRLLKQMGCGEAEFCLLGPVDESYPNAVLRSVIDADEAAGLIHYLGFTNRPQEVMGKPEVVVVVVSSYHEGMNRSLMEALSLGRPVITTDIPGCREMVDRGQNGYLVPAKDGQALADAMKNYLEKSAEQKAAMGRASRRLAEERFDVGHVIHMYENIITAIKNDSPK